MRRRRQHRNERDRFEKESVTHCREAVNVEHKRVQKLPKGKRLQHPAAEPPRPHPQAAVWLLAPHSPLILDAIPTKLKRTEHRINCNGDSQLLRRVDTKREACKGRTNSRRVHGCDCTRDTRVALAEWRCVGVQDVLADKSEETKQIAIEKQDGAER